jgi:folate-binding protein YgfZ
MSQEQWLLADIRAGIPHVFPSTHEAFVAQMLNLDALGGVSFEKGCYTGQEIVARMHFRGTVKRRMARYATGGQAPLPGARLISDGAHAGDVVYAVATDSGCELLAVINLSQADSVIQLEDRPTVGMQPLGLPYTVNGP